MPQIKAGNIKKGNYLLFRNRPVMVTKAEFSYPGKGSAFMKIKFRDLETGNSNEFTFKSTEVVEELDIASRELQYLYHDDTEAVFMDQRSYEQELVPVSLLEDKVKLLSPELKVYVLFHNDKPIGVSFPSKVRLTVTEAPDATAGNTQGSARKNVTLETGLVVQAPLFVKTGEKLVIDTDTLSYVSRA